MLALSTNIPSSWEEDSEFETTQESFVPGQAWWYMPRISKDQELKAGRGMTLNLELARAI